MFLYSVHQRARVRDPGQRNPSTTCLPYVAYVCAFGITELSTVCTACSCPPSHGPCGRIFTIGGLAMILSPTHPSLNAGSFRWERHCILEVQRALGKLSALQAAIANQVSDRWLVLANSLNLESTQDTRMSLRIHHPCGAAHHLLVILRFCVWINACTREFFPAEPEGSIPSSAIRGVDACYPFPLPTNQPTNQGASQLTSRKAPF